MNTEALIEEILKIAVDSETTCTEAGRRLSPNHRWHPYAFGAAMGQMDIIKIRASIALAQIRNEKLEAAA